MDREQLSSLSANVLFIVDCKCRYSCSVWT